MPSVMERRVLEVVAAAGVRGEHVASVPWRVLDGQFAGGVARRPIAEALALMMDRGCVVRVGGGRVVLGEECPRCAALWAMPEVGGFVGPRVPRPKRRGRHVSDCLPFDDVAGVCSACGDVLPRGRRRWCSDWCGVTYLANHRWGEARESALSRVVVSRSQRGRRYRCDTCGCTCGHSWDRSVPLAEVNHLVPALGAHSRESCAHHRENLQVLCRPCHLEETRRQHAAGELGGRPRQAEPSLF